MIPNVNERMIRPCNDGKDACVFHRMDATGCCNDWCECKASKYKGPDDRRDRPCDYHITGNEVVEMVDLLNNHKLAKVMPVRTLEFKNVDTTMVNYESK